MTDMEENLITSLKLAKRTLDQLQDNTLVEEPSEHSLLRLSSALKNIDREVNKLRNLMDVDLKTSV
jgi:hypothetical protein